MGYLQGQLLTQRPQGRGPSGSAFLIESRNRCDEEYGHGEMFLQRPVSSVARSGSCLLFVGICSQCAWLTSHHGPSVLYLE